MALTILALILWLIAAALVWDAVRDFVKYLKIRHYERQRSSSPLWPIRSLSYGVFWTVFQLLVALFLFALGLEAL